MINPSVIVRSTSAASVESAPFGIKPLNDTGKQGLESWTQVRYGRRP
jgi:hypothetical protein